MRSLCFYYNLNGTSRSTKCYFQKQLLTKTSSFSTSTRILMPQQLRRLEDLHFKNTFTSSLPRDQVTPTPPSKLPLNDALTEEQMRISRPVRGALYTFIVPEQQPDPRLVAVSQSALKLLDLDPAEVNKPNFLAHFSGNRPFKNTDGWSQAYGGHQFGYYAGQLGDGRAISLGEIVNSKGEKWELQLKGAGRTPYSRFGDGWAVLRSSIREFLCSEALATLNVPTSRALCCIATSRPVIREQVEKGAVVCRMAPSWIRFGTFELFYYRGERDVVRMLADYVIKNHYAEVDGPELDSAGLNKYGRLLREVTKRTAEMIAGWQAVGFCHGVMNTDNMSVLGITIDYGPFAFMEAYDPHFICNHSDTEGRYSFANQPNAALWNLSKFALTLRDLIGAKDGDKEGGDKGDGAADDRYGKATTEYERQGAGLIVEILQDFERFFMDSFTDRMRQKFGLLTPDSSDMDVIVAPILDLLSLMELDYTRFFRQLSSYSFARDSSTEFLAGLGNPESKILVSAENEKAFSEWVSVYRERVERDEGGTDEKERSTRMKKVNPKFVLRNWIAQEAIERAEKGDYTGVRSALRLCCEDPFGEGQGVDEAERWSGRTPKWGKGLICSCSS